LLLANLDYDVRRTRSTSQVARLRIDSNIPTPPNRSFFLLAKNARKTPDAQQRPGQQKDQKPAKMLVHPTNSGFNAEIKIGTEKIISPKNTGSDS
jgi:hypothetical protein